MSPRFGVGPALLVLLGLLGCRAQGPTGDATSARDPVRLLQRAEGVALGGVVRLSDHELPPWVVRPAVAEGFQLPPRVREITMLAGGVEGTRDSRLSLLAPSGSRYRFELEIPRSGGRLETAFGYLLSPDTAARTILIRISLHTLGDGDGGEWSSLVDESFRTRAADGWRPFRLPLDAWAGQSVEVELAVDDPTFGDPAAGDPGAGSPGIGTPSILWGAWASPELVGGDPRGPGWDLLLVSLDTLRADHLGCYGHDRSTSPHLDRLAASGVRFETAVSQAPWTRPSHRALFTGLNPSSNAGLSAPPLARVLWQHGWRTGALTGGGQVDASFGFHDGFASYAVQYWVDDLEIVKDWYESSPGQRNFLFLHTFEIHDPYTDNRFTHGLERGRIGDRFETAMWVDWQYQLSDAEKTLVEALYDGGIARVDGVLGELFDWLDVSGRLDHTIVVVTSDHGEQFFEHGGWRHGTTVFDHELLVPLIVHLPPPLRQRFRGARGGSDSDPWVVSEPVRLIDLYPTLLELLEIPFEPRIQGRSLVPLMGRATQGEPTREGLAQGCLAHGCRESGPVLALSENVNLDTYERKSLRSGRWKLIWQTPKGANAHLREESVQLFDLRRDPLEQHDISERHPEAVARLLDQLRRIATGAGGLDEGVPAGLDPELVEQLRSLGYVQ